MSLLDDVKKQANRKETIKPEEINALLKPEIIRIVAMKATDINAGIVVTYEDTEKVIKALIWMQERMSK